jgi:hypothetical protein
VNDQLELTGLDRLERAVKSLGEISYAPLMKSWEDILQEDNTRAAMAGLDGEGVRMDTYAPVTYRPKAVKLIDYKILANNNLTSSHYRSLAGPPLAPRGMQSRIVTNYRTASAELSDGRWTAIGAWEDVLSTTGVSFLRYHFTGSGALPVRDLRGIRPDVKVEARRSLRDFLMQYMRSFRGR